MPSIFDREQVNVDAIKPAEALQAIYLDWWNNFLTREYFAEHYGLTLEAASELIDAGYRAHESLVQRQKWLELLK